MKPPTHQRRSTLEEKRTETTQALTQHPLPGANITNTEAKSRSSSQELGGVHRVRAVNLHGADSILPGLPEFSAAYLVGVSLDFRVLLQRGIRATRTVIHYTGSRCSHDLPFFEVFLARRWNYRSPHTLIKLSPPCDENLSHAFQGINPSDHGANLQAARPTPLKFFTLSDPSPFFSQAFGPT
jgi:hypothetical protein